MPSFGSRFAFLRLRRRNGVTTSSPNTPCGGGKGWRVRRLAVWKKALLGLLLPASAFAAWLLLAPLPENLEPPLSRVVRYRDGSLMRVYLSSDEKWRIWTPLEKIDPLLVKATLAYEDRRFWKHPGIDPLSVIRACVQNIRLGRVFSGGSTLTMQLARLAEPKPRTLWSKLREMARALQFEVRLGKRRILEIYLNRTPCGGNFEGVAAASLAYFGKPPGNLSAGEAAYLVSLPQSPAARSPFGGNAKAALEARNRVLDRMESQGLTGPAEAARARSSPVPAKVLKFPSEGLHAADYVRLQYPLKTDLLTTLDRRIQQMAEGFAKAHAVRLRDLGAHNGAIVVIDNRTRQVRALVGSLDYWDSAEAGQILGFHILRSPGSALKPFLYALALQQGIVTPVTLLEDVPARVGNFRPANFSRTYQGLVTAESALAQSLNLPFIDLLERTGYDGFLSLAEALDLRAERDTEYGFTIITGGMEVTLLDLTNAYATLGRSGMHGPFQVLMPEKGSDVREHERALLDPGAVSLTLRALSLRDRPDAPRGLNRKGAVYWKTGTSWGRRDAWCIGLNKDYTVGVWVGNFSAEGAEGLVGSRAAAPIMFDLLTALSPEPRPLPMEMDYLMEIPVCSLSGLPPSSHCPETRTTLVVRDRTPSRRCPLHRAFLLEVATGYRAHPWKRYRPGEVENRVFTVYPPLAAAVMGLKATLAPPFAPGDTGLAHKTGLRLEQPGRGMTYMITKGIRHANRIPLLAWTDTLDGKVFWFVNDRFVEETRAGETRFLDPGPGEYRIVALDSAGNTVSAQVRVQDF
jgi:penicillin-binding protein 1C